MPGSAHSDMAEHRDSAMLNRRRNIRATIQRRVVVRGLDAKGNPIERSGLSVDFSRRGLGLVIEGAGLRADSHVSVSVPGRFHSRARVKWVVEASASGANRVGVELLDPAISHGLRVAAGFLLVLALAANLSYSRTRVGWRSQVRAGCAVTVEQMKARIAEVLGPLALVGPSERAFVHVQHEHMGCDGYTMAYEHTGFFGDARKSEAVAKWHWQTYHSQDEAVRETAVQGIESSLAGSQ